MTATPVLHKRSDRMRYYEDLWRATLPQQSFVILRVDGRAFHTLTRGMDKPFDAGFMSAMNAAALALCEEVQGPALAYLQSDEISVLMTDFNANQQQWFGGVVQKMCSIAASVVSVRFSQFLALAMFQQAVFDARVFPLPSREEAINYFLWRQADCHRNAISMIAEAHFSSKQLTGKNSPDRIEMLAAKGVDVNSYPEAARLGRVAVKVAGEGPVTYTRKDTGETLTETVTRTWWEIQPAPWFDWDQAGFLEANVPQRPPATHIPASERKPA